MIRSRICVFSAKEYSESSSATLTKILRRQGASVRSATRLEDCVGLLRRGDCDLLILEVDGDVEDAVRLLAESDHMFPKARKLVLVKHGDVSTAVKVMKAGATDCLDRPLKQSQLLSAVNALLSEAAARSQDLQVNLTRIEATVLHYILAGRTSQEIATLLDRSPKTIEAHRSKIMRKLGASGPVGLVKRAVEIGFLDLRVDRLSHT